MAEITIIGIYANNKLMFEDAQVVHAQVIEQSKFMEHPIESGSTITDHKIIMPIVIRLSLLLSKQGYANVFKQIKSDFYKSTPFIVQTRSDVYKNMVIQEMPHEEDAEHFDALVMGVTLKQVFTIKSSKVGITKAKLPKNEPTKDKGTTQPKSSVAYGLFK